MSLERCLGGDYKDGAAGSQAAVTREGRARALSEPRVRPSVTEVLRRAERLLVAVGGGRRAAGFGLGRASAVLTRTTLLAVFVHLAHAAAHAAALCVGDADAAEAERAGQSERDDKFVSQSLGSSLNEWNWSSASLLLPTHGPSQ